MPSQRHIRFFGIAAAMLFAAVPGHSATITNGETSSFTAVETVAGARGLRRPAGIAVDPSTGNVFIADTKNHQIKVVTPTGAVSVLAGSGKPGNSDGTGLEAELAGGTTQALQTLHVRATEYSVGPNGRAAMPASLPPQTAYTYCVELSVDEAMRFRSASSFPLAITTVCRVCGFRRRTASLPRSSPSAVDWWKSI